MLELIVLGQIPGTQIQINFYSWLLIVTGLLIWVELIVLARRWLHGRRYKQLMAFIEFAAANLPQALRA